MAIVRDAFKISATRFDSSESRSFLRFCEIDREGHARDLASIFKAKLYSGNSKGKTPSSLGSSHRTV